RTSKPDASNREMVSIPEQPDNKLLQDSAALLPTGVTAPRPVTTTRRGSDIALIVAESRESRVTSHESRGHLVLHVAWRKPRLAARDPRLAAERPRLLARCFVPRSEQCDNGVVQTDRLDVAADATDQARQNFAGSDLNECVHA